MGNSEGSLPGGQGQGQGMSQKNPFEMDAIRQQQWEDTWAQLCASYNQNSSSSSDSNGTRTPEGGTPLVSDYGSLVSPTFPFQCPICFCDVRPGHGVTLQTCFHSFCKECLVGSMEHSEGVQFQCPFQDDFESCPAFILDKEVKALCPEDVLERILKRSIRQAEMSMPNSLHCSTVNCDGWIEVTEGAIAYNCILCEKVNCIKCKAIHEAISCEEYEQRLKEAEADRKTIAEMEKLATKDQAMKCPQCNIWIIKIQGCDYLICLACRTGICWATKGFRWGPKGPGDVTGGCRCMVDGLRCAPHCRNCH